MSTDANAMAVWWRDFADPNMSSLTRTQGSFERCSGDTEDGHIDTSDGLWVTDPPPRGMFTDERIVAASEFASYDDGPTTAGKEQGSSPVAGSLAIGPSPLLAPR